MDKFHIPNRQRRRSNLGRRNRTSENPPRIESVSLMPPPTSYGRFKSAEEINTQTNLPKSVETSFAKKRLFLTSPMNQISSYRMQAQTGNYRDIQESQKYAQQCSANTSMNETGVNVLTTTPSPSDKEKSSDSQKYCGNNKIERPKSPGMSYYNQFIITKHRNLKPPVDPDDTLDFVTSSSLERPTVEELEFKLQNLSTEHDKINNFSSLIDDGELNSTNSFILAEQTIIDKDQTLNESPPIKEAGSASKSIIKQCNRLETVLEEEAETDAEDEILQQTLSKLNTMMVEIENTKKLVHTLIKNKKKRKAKTGNKENCPMTANKQIKEWMSEMKSENPGLLKTPKPLKKHNLSIAEQSTIWTPHSLSTVLNDQMDNLFK